jgi:hypothetical protein
LTPGQRHLGSYLVDGLRTLMISGSTSTVGLGCDLAVLALGLVALVGLGAALYPKVIT